MAWTYSDWVTQTTSATRLSRLRLHIQEVSDKLQGRASGDGISYDPGQLRQYIKDLREDERTLAGASNGKRVVRPRVRG